MKLVGSRLTPFHHAFAVYDLEQTRHFYSKILGCQQGREAPGLWIDFNLFGHQIVSHKVPEAIQKEHMEIRSKMMRNHVDGHHVPVPHFGVVLEWNEFSNFAERLKQQKVKFEIEPYLRFKGQAGEQQTMFFFDPSGNALEFKSFKNIKSQLFEK